MKSGYRADVEAAKLRSLLAERQVQAGDFGQVRVSGGAWHLSPQVADWHALKGDQEQYEYRDKWSSRHVRSSEKDGSFAEVRYTGTSNEE
jgi:hypothetical protein